MSSFLRNVAMTAAVILLAVYAAVALQGPQGVPALLEKRREVMRLQEENATLQREIDRKRERIRILGEQPDQLELEVRKQLNLGKEGETIFFLPGQPKDQPPAKQPKQ